MKISPISAKFVMYFSQFHAIWSNFLMNSHWFLKDLSWILLQIFVKINQIFMGIFMKGRQGIIIRLNKHYSETHAWKNNIVWWATTSHSQRKKGRSFLPNPWPPCECLTDNYLSSRWGFSSWSLTVIYFIVCKDSISHIWLTSQIHFLCYNCIHVLKF